MWQVKQLQCSGALGLLRLTPSLVAADRPSVVPQLTLHHYSTTSAVTPSVAMLVPCHSPAPRIPHPSSSLYAHCISKPFPAAGRLDRKIEFPHPNEEARAKILQIHSRKMTVSPDVNFEELARSTDDFNAAQLKAVSEAAARMCVCVCVCPARRYV